LTVSETRQWWPGRKLLGSRAEAFKLTSQGRLQTVVSEREALDSLIVHIKADSTADKSVLDSLGNRLKEWKLKEKNTPGNSKRLKRLSPRPPGVQRSTPLPNGRHCPLSGNR
jgi:hypothetical protein